MRVNEEKLSNRRKQRKNKKLRKVILTVLLAVGAVIIAVAAYAWSRISKAEDAIHQKVETVQLREKELTDDSSFSVLLLGIDNGAYGRDTEVGRSDTMLLVTVNPKQKKTTMISIPRDSYTEIIGYGTFDKINHAYAFGKEQFSINSVQNMLNVPIDYYVTVDMGGLMGLVDAVGGLEITPALTFTYEEESFTEGVTRHVDGEAALRYARMRYDDPEGDTGRQKRQQYVIQKLVEKLSLPINIIGMPIHREKNGLAMSSRNMRLTSEQRESAKIIFETLVKVKDLFHQQTLDEIHQFVENTFKNSDFELEYFIIANEKTLREISEIKSNETYRAFIVVVIDGVRLIDNIQL